MNHRPKIAVIHPNSLCCLAMRTILTDIAPFVGMFREVDIAAYNSMEEFLDDAPDMTIHYFIASEILAENMEYFAPLHRRCIVLTRGFSCGRYSSSRTRVAEGFSYDTQHSSYGTRYGAPRG